MAEPMQGTNTPHWTDSSSPLHGAADLQPQAVGADPTQWFTADVLPLLLASILMLGLAIWLVRRAPSRINVAFAVLFVARSIGHIAEVLWQNMGTLHIRDSEFRHLLPLSNIAVVFAAIWFLWVYLAQNRAEWAKKEHVGTAIVVAGLVLTLIYLLWPSLYWYTATGPGWSLTVPGGYLFGLSGLYYPLYAVFAFLLIRESIQDLPDHRRQSTFFAGLGFLFLSTYIAVGELVFVDILDYFGTLGLEAFIGPGFWIGHAAALLALIPIVGAFVIVTRDWLQNPQRKFARAHAILLFVTIALPIATVVLATYVFTRGGVEAAGDATAMFQLFQGIWTIPYPILVAYGLLRFQQEDQQDEMGKQLKRFAMTALFFTSAFAISEGIEAFFSNRFGTWIGLAGAAGITIVMEPIQNKLKHSGIFAESSTGETHQEIDFYREQVRKTLEDGQIGAAERRFLANLQDTMGIKDETADRIENELRATLHGGTPSPDA